MHCLMTAIRRGMILKSFQSQFTSQNFPLKSSLQLFSPFSSWKKGKKKLGVLFYDGSFGNDGLFGSRLEKRERKSETETGSDWV